jgi:hypothetical protein
VLGVFELEEEVTYVENSSLQKLGVDKMGGYVNNVNQSVTLLACLMFEMS